MNLSIFSSRVFLFGNTRLKSNPNGLLPNNAGINWARFNGLRLRTQNEQICWHFPPKVGISQKHSQKSHGKSLRTQCSRNSATLLYKSISAGEGLSPVVILSDWAGAPRVLPSGAHDRRTSRDSRNSACCCSRQAE